MTAPAATILRVVDVSPDGPDVPVGTISLVNGQLEFSDPSLEPLLRRWRVSNIPDAQTFAELSDGGWSNGYVAIKP